MSSPESNASRGATLRFTHDEVYAATVTEGDDGVETCTISPLPTTEARLLTEWVSASGASFVDLASMR
jgi:hypothetical protein